MSLGMTPQSALLVIWITFTAVTLCGVTAVLVWAVRSRQFSDQDRARRLPLESGIPEPMEKDPTAKEDAHHAAP